MPKRNVYVSEQLDEILRSHEFPIPLSSLVQEAVLTFVHTELCPTCGTKLKIRPIEVETVPKRRPDPDRVVNRRKKIKVRR